MYGRLQTKTRGQAQRELVFAMAQFSGALNVDKPASKLGLIRPGRRTIYNEMPLLENMIAFPDRLEGRSGSQIFSNTTMPGSGTIHALKQHPVSGEFVLHRGSQIWYADNAATTWTELLSPNSTTQVPTVAGDTGIHGAQFPSGFTINNANSSNTNSGILYWNITHTGLGPYIVTISVYKDSGKTQLVASCVVTCTTNNGAFNGTLAFIQNNNSGIRIIANNFAYYSDMIGAGQTITLSMTAPYFRLITDSNSSLIVYKNDFILSLGSIGNESQSLIYIDLTKSNVYSLSAPYEVGYPASSVSGLNSQSAATPYGRRYLKTFCRIVDANGNYNASLNRVTGILQFEGPSNISILNSAYNIQTTTDYGEVWTSNPPSISNPSSISWGGSDYGSAALYTHIGIYATMDIGVNGIDPVTGVGNNRELYIWLDDVEITSGIISSGFPAGFLVWNYTDQTMDAILRARYASGFGLRTRFWVEMPIGEIGGIGGSFLYRGLRTKNYMSYCQLDNPVNMGYYRPDLQFFNVTDGLQQFYSTQDVFVILTTRKTYYSNFKIFTDAGTISGSVFVMNGPILVSDTIGCNDYGSIASIDASGFIAHCSDHSIRIFSGISWQQTDYSDPKVSSIIRTIIAGGSVGIYFMGHYTLWYSTNSSDTFPTKCIRLGLGGPSGIGWSTITGASFPFPPKYVGSVLIIDANGIQRILVLDSVTSTLFWIETFISRTLMKIFKDAAAVDGTGGVSIIPKFQTMEISDPDESDIIYHSESHCFLRSIQAQFVSGMTLTVNAYVNGGTTPLATINASTSGGDIQFWEKIVGNRIKLEFVFSETGQQVVSMDCLYQSLDVKAIGDGPPQTAEAANQLALSQNLTEWLCRPRLKLNRVNLKQYSLLGGNTPTLTTGPDGNSFALLFPVNSYYQISDTTVYSQFTAMFWIKGSPGAADIILQLGSSIFYIQFPDATHIKLSGNAGTLTVITSFASAWSHIAIVANAGSAVIYQNGIAIATVTVSLPSSASTFNIRFGGSIASFSMDDIRAYTSLLTAANILFYYNDIKNNSGNKVLPQV